MMPLVEKVIQCMLAMQRHPWEQGVCSCPHFISEGTSAEAQAAFVMADAWRRRTAAPEGNPSHLS